MGKGVNMPSIGRSKCHGKGGPYTMGKGVDIPLVGDSIYHG